MAKYCSAHICDVLKDTPAFKDGDMELGLKQSFLRMDDLIRKPAGQAELLALKKASQGGSDSDDGDEGEGDRCVIFQCFCEDLGVDVKAVHSFFFP